MTESKDFRAGTRSLKWEKDSVANLYEILLNFIYVIGNSQSSDRSANIRSATIGSNYQFCDRSANLGNFKPQCVHSIKHRTCHRISDDLF